MFIGIKNFFRERMLRKHESDIQTGMLPLSEIKTANVLMDIENPDYDVLKEKVLAWFRNNNIKGEIWYIDFRKLDKNTLLLTSIQTTIIKKELNWFGAPSLEKLNNLLENKTDLFISLTDKTYFVNILMSKCSKARFKIGRIPLDHKTYDMVFKTEADSLLGNSAMQVFTEITAFLKKVN